MTRPLDHIEAFEVIPSFPQEKGWEAFRRALPTIVSGKQRSTRRLIRILHRLRTAGVSLPEPTHDIKRAMYGDALILSGMSADEAFGIIMDITEPSELEAAIDSVKSGDLTTENGERINTHILRRGHLRSGHAIETAPESDRYERVYSAHNKPIDGLNFMGLELDLDRIFNQLCDRFDELWKEAETLDEQVAAIVWFQLWGCSVIHPFFDANGRAFGSHLIAHLQKIGLDVNEMPGLPRVLSEARENLLRPIGTHFLTTFLEESGIQMLEIQQIRKMPLGSKKRNEYQEKLRDAIEAGIAMEYDLEGRLADFFTTGIAFMNAYLSREGFMNDDRKAYNDLIEVYDSNRLHPEVVLNGTLGFDLNSQGKNYTGVIHYDATQNFPTKPNKEHMSTNIFFIGMEINDPDTGDTVRNLNSSEVGLLLESSPGTDIQVRGAITQALFEHIIGEVNTAGINLLMEISSADTKQGKQPGSADVERKRSLYTGERTCYALAHLGVPLEHWEPIRVYMQLFTEFDDGEWEPKVRAYAHDHPENDWHAYGQIVDQICAILNTAAQGR